MLLRLKDCSLNRAPVLGGDCFFNGISCVSISDRFLDRSRFRSEKASKKVSNNQNLQSKPSINTKPTIKTCTKSCNHNLQSKQSLHSKTTIKTYSPVLGGDRFFNAILPLPFRIDFRIDQGFDRKRYRKRFRRGVET